jgi:hypothetical protein
VSGGCKGRPEKHDAADLQRRIRVNVGQQLGIPVREEALPAELGPFLLVNVNDINHGAPPQPTSFSSFFLRVVKTKQSCLN